MNSEDPLAAPRNLRNAAILVTLLFWLPLTVIIIVAATR